MANISRQIGNNIFAHLKEINVSPEKFAYDLGYSDRDGWAMLEGKKLIAPCDLKKIANYLHMDMDHLFNEIQNPHVLGLEYRKKFENPDNLDIVLDLIDEYVACKEAMN